MTKITLNPQHLGFAGTNPLISLCRIHSLIVILCGFSAKVIKK